MRVLIIEDDSDLAEMIGRMLTNIHITVDYAADGLQGLDMGLRGMYDIIILDWMLPGQDGPAICRALRTAAIRTGLLMLTARAAVLDRVLGFESGADDYLVKPFAMAELRLRVQALARRMQPTAPGSAELRSGPLVLDTVAHTAQLATRPLDLTPTEWTVLEYLMRNRGHALSRQQILDYVWSFDTEVQLSLVDVYISHLRRKLAQPQHLPLIETVRGIGYRLRAE